MKCSNCGIELADGVIFCRECGKKVVLPQKRFCRECGKMLEEGSKFCSYCGANLNAIEEMNQAANTTDITYSEANSISNSEKRRFNHEQS